MSENITVPRAELDLIKAELAILRKSTSKSKIARNTPREDIGLSIMVSTYKKDFEDEAKIITSWELVKNFVRSTKDRGLEEDQVMRIYFDQELSKGKKLAYAGQKSKLDTKLAACEDEAEKAKIHKQLEEIQVKVEAKEYEDMPYRNFITDISKVEVVVIGTSVRGGKTYYEFKHEDKEYSIDSKFIN